MKDTERVWVQIETLEIEAARRKTRREVKKQQLLVGFPLLSMQLWQINAHQYLIIPRSLSTNSTIRGRGVIQGAAETTAEQKNKLQHV